MGGGEKKKGEYTTGIERERVRKKMENEGFLEVVKKNILKNEIVKLE